MQLKIVALGAKGIPHPGGIELVMEEIGSRLVRRGHRFDIFVRKSYMNGKTFKEYKGIKLLYSPGIRHKNLDAVTHSLSALPRILSNGYDIVYVNAIGLSVLAWLPRICGKKVVVHTHGLDWKREKWGRLAKKLIRMSAWTTARLPHRIFCVCKEDKRFFEKNYGIKCVYVPNGIPNVEIRIPHEIKKFGLSGGDYLLFMARLVPEKGAHLLIQAWRMIPGAYKKDKKLVIAGDSNHRDKYYLDLIEFKRFNDIVFTGFATGNLKEELLTNALCFVQPSLIEGMPLSILEAMGCGRPILTSDIPENKDVLEDNGLFFKSGNINDLAEKIKEILTSNPHHLYSQGKRLQEFGRRQYDWDKITDRIEVELISLINED